MKKIFILITTMLLGTVSFAGITNIVGLSNPQLLFNYDVADDSILNFENRLIVSNKAKTEELLILPNGELEKISFFDVSSTDTMISGNRLIIPNKEPNRGFFLFDLSKTPMELITYVDMWGKVNPFSWRNQTFFNEEYIMIQCQFQNLIHLICKETGNYEGTIPGINTSFTFTDISNDVYIQVSQYQNGLRLQLFYQNEFGNFDLISSRDLFYYGTYVSQINVEDSKIIISTESHLFITDISIPENPIIINSINLNRSLFSFYYSDGLIFTFDLGTNLREFRLNASGNYQLINTKKIDGISFGTNSHSLHYVEPYLYLNGEIALFVFNIENNLEVVNHHGKAALLPNFSVSKNDVYYAEIDLFKTIQRIYSVLDNTLVATLNYQHMSTDKFYPILPIDFMHFDIIDDKLYVSHIRDNVHYFDIFHIENQVTTLSKSISLGNSSLLPIMVIIENRVFFTYLTTEQTSVYDLDNDTLNFITSFQGKIQYRWASQPTSFILNSNNNTLYVRDLSVPTKILFQTSIDNLVSNSYIFYIDDSHFSLLNNSTNNYFSQINFIDINNRNYEILKSISNRTVIPLNGIMTAYRNSSFVPNISEFYAAIDNEIALVGSMNYGNRSINPSYTYFFPGREKMVLLAPGGIWVYDVEFEPVSDDDFVIPQIKNELLSNFPNPFNPDTTIKFVIESDGDVEIDIFNIRGQKIKSLVNDFYNSGHHNVTWNGTDDNGNVVSSGVYLYRMKIGDFSETRRMEMLK